MAKTKADTPPVEVRAAITAAKDGLQQSELVGNCPINARRLYDELTARDIDAQIVLGGCEIPDCQPPETLRDAEDMGIVHWWVEAQVDGEMATVDLATEIEPIRGETLFRFGRPDQYVPFERNPPHTEGFATRSDNL